MTDTEEAYERGKRDARLDNHDLQLIEFAADIKIMFVKLDALAVNVQALALNAKASADATVALAAAVKTERDTARDTLAADRAKADTAWSPYARVMGLATAGAGLLGSIYVFTH